MDSKRASAYNRRQNPQKAMRSVLTLTPSKETIDTITFTIGDRYRVDSVLSLDECLAQFKKARYEITFIDLAYLVEDGFMGTTSKAAFQKIFEQFREVYLTASIVVVSTQDQIRNLIQAVKSGANHYLIMPLDPQALLHCIEDLEASTQVQSELEMLRHSVWDDDRQGVTKTNSPVMQAMFDQAHSVADTDSSVLLLGESGVGKGVLARLIHRNSARRDGPFVHVHCGAIPDNLIESELFGHEKGSFTGAVKRKLGRFEIAKKGTIFLDEIGTISPAAQTKLLQVLQDHIMQRVGGETMLETDVRVIAATNEDLLERSKTGEFREDLYYRLNVFPITVPPLRERIEDIPLLANNFLNYLEGEYGRKVLRIHPDTFKALQKYSFPGNIRELENIMERAYILEKSDTLTPQSLPSDFIKEEKGKGGLVVDAHSPLAEVRQRAVEQVELAYLSQLLTRHKGKIKDSAETAGITTRQLHKLLTKYNLKKEQFKQTSGSDRN